MIQYAWETCSIIYSVPFDGKPKNSSKLARSMLILIRNMADDALWLPPVYPSSLELHRWCILNDVIHSYARLNLHLNRIYYVAGSYTTDRIYLKNRAPVSRDWSYKDLTRFIQARVKFMWNMCPFFTSAGDIYGSLHTMNHIKFLVWCSAPHQKIEGGNWISEFHWPVVVFVEWLNGQFRLLSLSVIGWIYTRQHIH